MKKYKFFATYLSIVFSCFAYAVFTPPQLTPLSAHVVLTPPLLTPLSAHVVLTPPQLAPLSPPDLAPVLEDMIEENAAANLTPSTSSQNTSADQKYVSVVQRLSKLQGKRFIEELNHLQDRLARAQLKSEDDIAKFIVLFYQIAKHNPKRGTKNFSILYNVSYKILESSYHYFSLRKQEFLFLFFFDSTLRAFPKLGNVGVRAMCDFFVDNKRKFDLESPFYKSFLYIYNEKILGSKKQETHFKTENPTSFYISRYFDGSTSTSEEENYTYNAKYLEELMPTLKVLFEKMLQHGDDSELGKTIIKNLSKDDIVTAYPLFCAHSLDLVFLLLEIELDRPYTLENEKIIAEILTIAQNFSKEEAYFYFKHKMLMLSDKAPSEKWVPFMQSYIAAPR